MAKVRVHELAKKFGIKNAEVIKKLTDAGLSVKTHSSSVEEDKAVAILKGEGKAKAAARPQTMVRRRRPAPEPEPTPVVEAEAPVAEVVEAAVAPATPALTEPAVETKTVEPAVAETKSTDVAKDAPSAAVVTEAPAKTDEVAPAEATPPAATETEAKTPAASAPAGDTKVPTTPAAPASPSNVVRVIDPNAIKQRLAAEGRSFQPRPSRFSKVREIRVVNDRSGNGPRMVDVTSGGRGPNSGPGAGPARNGQTKRNQSYRNNREQRNKGRDLWFNPGRKKKSGKKGRGPEITQAAAHKRVVEMGDMISVNDLAHKMAIKAGQVIGKLMSMGMMVTMNQTIDADTATIVANEFGFETKNVAVKEEDFFETATIAVEEEGNMVPRAPVVTVMGHVDHGKTSLLDVIRKANVVSGEAGGITQHIGAYSVETPKGVITFLDTPGHAAFTSMRARGAGITDITILVVAADDGVMPQTKEAIAHSKDAGVPIVVAINKCDKPNARPERVMQELTEHGLVSEEWGGDTQMVQISALKKTGIEDLLEAINLQAEILDLKAAPDNMASGAIVEAQLDKGRGPVATVLVQQGSLRTGQFIVAGVHHGKVRAMYNSKGERLKVAGPSTPVAVLGLGGVPNAGDTINAVADDKTAKRIAEHRTQKMREQELQKTSRVSLENFLSTPIDNDLREIRLVIKADVDGSVEAVRKELKDLATAKVGVQIVHSGVGTITESDINLAVASDAIVIGFNSKPDAKASALAQHETVDVRTYSVIYEARDEVKAAMAGLLAPKIEEREKGRADVREVFRVPKLGAIAGSFVSSGKIHRSFKARVMRNGKEVHAGEIVSLKRFKDDAREVGNGYECGIGVSGYADFEEGDQIVCFEEYEVKPELDEALVNIKPTAETAPAAEAQA